MNPIDPSVSSWLYYLPGGSTGLTEKEKTKGRRLRRKKERKRKPSRRCGRENDANRQIDDELRPLRQPKGGIGGG